MGLGPPVCPDCEIIMSCKPKPNRTSWICDRCGWFDKLPGGYSDPRGMCLWQYKKNKIEEIEKRTDEWYKK